VRNCLSRVRTTLRRRDRFCGACGVGLLGLAVFGTRPALSVERCPGDCDGDGVVRAHELVEVIRSTTSHGSDAEGVCVLPLDAVPAVVASIFASCEPQRENTPSPSVTREPTMVASVTPTIAVLTPTEIHTSTPTDTMTSTPNSTDVNTTTPTTTSSTTATRTATRTASETPTATGEPTVPTSPTRRATSSATSTRTQTPTASRTMTSTASQASTATRTGTHTKKPTETSMPTLTTMRTSTRTAMATASKTSTPTAPTVTASRTRSPSSSATPTHTPTPTASRTATAPATATRTRTPTQAPSTATPTQSTSEFSIDITAARCEIVEANGRAFAKRQVVALVKLPVNAEVFMSANGTFSCSHANGTCEVGEPCVTCEAYSGTNPRNCPEGINLRLGSDPKESTCTLIDYGNPIELANASPYTVLRTEPFDSTLLTSTLLQCPESPYGVDILESECGFVQDPTGRTIQKYAAVVRVRAPVGGTLVMFAGDAPLPNVCDTDLISGNCALGEDCISCNDWTGVDPCRDSSSGTGNMRQDGDPIESICTIVEYQDPDRPDPTLPPGESDLLIYNLPYIGERTDSTIICE
jgi:hypothetical protein